MKYFFLVLSFLIIAAHLSPPSEAMSGRPQPTLMSPDPEPPQSGDVTDHSDLISDHMTTGSRPWRAPQYQSQESPLGYSAEAFAVPAGMEKQVQFWIDVYTKYTTSEGVIHDLEDLSKIYAVVDFKDIENDNSIARHRKEFMKQKKIDRLKKQIALEKLLTPEAISNMRFQLGQKDRMAQAIYYSGRYLEDMEKIFQEGGLPIELTRLVFVESSFNILARSKVGASGLWQIMPYTARPYGYINSAVDRRNHPLDATRLAVKILRSNYKMLEDWPLAVTGYNHGPTGVKKMTEKYKTRKLAELVEQVESRRSFGFASRNFYASFLAALHTEANAEKYFGKVIWSEKLPAEELKLPVAVAYRDVLAWFNGDDKVAQIFNPHLSHAVRKKGQKIPPKTLVAVPREKYNEVLVALTKPQQNVAVEEPRAKKSSKR